MTLPLQSLIKIIKNVSIYLYIPIPFAIIMLFQNFVRPRYKKCYMETLDITSEIALKIGGEFTKIIIGIRSRILVTPAGALPPHSALFCIN